jgi:hypothetical protein
MVGECANGDGLMGVLRQTPFTSVRTVRGETEVRAGRGGEAHGARRPDGATGMAGYERSQGRSRAVGYPGMPVASRAARTMASAITSAASAPTVSKSTWPAYVPVASAKIVSPSTGV